MRECRALSCHLFNHPDTHTQSTHNVPSMNFIIYFYWSQETLEMRTTATPTAAITTSPPVKPNESEFMVFSLDKSFGVTSLLMTYDAIRHIRCESRVSTLKTMN